MQERLQKILAASGIASRRKSEELITSGRVTVDGQVVTELGTRADPEKQTIAIDGMPISKEITRHYILLNKPKGYTSSRSDPHAKHLVTELVKEIPVPLYPVGRLDVDTEGLLILTNDGDFAYTLTHPKHQIPKTYRAVVKGRITPEDIRRLQTGIELDDGMTTPAKARLLRVEQNGRASVVELTITEGRKRQVRRMFGALGHPVISLVRTHIGSIGIGSLKPGTWRHLTQAEIESLRR